MTYEKPLVNIGLKLLAKGMVACSRVEPEIVKEIKAYEDGFIIELKVLNTKSKVAVMKIEKEFIYLGSENYKDPDLSIMFKSYQGALMLILGKIGLYEGYAQHRFIVKGDFLKAMPLVRILYYVEAYLFPKFIAKSILKEMPQLTSSKLSVCLKILFIERKVKV